MNKEWSQLHKTMQQQLKKEATYKDGILTLLELRKQLMDTLLRLTTEMSREGFDAMPFLHANGYHNKNIAYSLWHIFRIEDIVAHVLIQEDEQIFFAQAYDKRIHTPIITTGNELVKEQIALFSKALDIQELYAYGLDVKECTDKMVKQFSYQDLRKKIPFEKKVHLQSLHVVSEDENAAWLIDYWCEKDIRGLIQMPFSRHWIMHVEAVLRIKQKLHSK